MNSLREKRNTQLDPIEESLRIHGAVDAIINMSASPYFLSKPKIRTSIFTTLATAHKTTVLVCGQVGANDQLLFDGQSMVIEANGHMVPMPNPASKILFFMIWATHLVKCRLFHRWMRISYCLKSYHQGIRDYVEKCRMKGVIIGVSGGIDSAVCLALAVRALGTTRVRAFFLPSQYTCAESRVDAEALTTNFNLEFEELPI